MPDALVRNSAPVPLVKGAKYAVTVKLTPNVKWSDGSPLTSSDFVGQYDALWALQDPIWLSLVDVQAPDPTTLVFQLKQISQDNLRTLIRWNQTQARSVYGAVFDEMHALRLKGTDPTTAPVTTLTQKLQKIAPDRPVVYGPYVVDPSSVTTQQMVMSKNARGFNADKIGFDKIIVNWGSTQQTVPLLLNNQLDYTTDVLTPSDVRAVSADKNVELLRNPLGTGTGIWFNEAINPFGKKEFRQAVAYVVDRARNATVSLGDAGKPIKYMAGFSDIYVPEWLDKSVLPKLNPYTRNEQRAGELLTSIGLSKQGAVWKDASGKTISFEITAPTDFPDFLASAKDVSEQLNDFGFQTTVRGIPAADRPNTIKQGKYQAMLDFSLVSTPGHPATSLDWNMAAGIFGTNNPEAKGGSSKGLDWPWRQTAADGTKVYIPDLLARSIAGFDRTAQRAPVATLAEIFNDQLPVVPLFERYTTDPIAHGPRVEGWLPATNSIYKNNQGSDNYISMQILSGTLTPAGGGDGTFRTSAPYAQPPDLSYNAYASNALYTSMTSPSYDVSYPPLFWFSESEQHYIAAVGLSYSIYPKP